MLFFNFSVCIGISVILTCYTVIPHLHSLMQLHTSGIVTDLPVHCSSEEEITGLLSTVSQNLKKITLTPTLVTIARYLVTVQRNLI